MEVLAMVAKEALGVVRAALADWPLTARLCMIIIVVATTICASVLMLRQ